YEEASVLVSVGNIDKHADKLVSIVLALKCPTTVDRLRFPGYSPELLLEFQDHVRKQYLRHLRAVIEFEWKKHFVAPVSFVHKSRDLRRKMEFQRSLTRPVHREVPAFRQTRKKF